MSEFTCHEFKPASGSAKLLGRAKIGMPSGLILLCSVLQGERGPWVCPPSRSWTDGQGTKRYEDLVEFASPERKRAWQDLALAAVRPHLTAPTREEAQDGAYCPF